MAISLRLNSEGDVQVDSDTYRLTPVNKRRNCRADSYSPVILADDPCLKLVPPEVWATGDYDEGFTNVTPYRAVLKKGSQPVYIKQYPLNKEREEGIRPLIDNFLQQGLLEKAVSPYNSPIHPIKKPDGTYRFVQDLRAINSLDSFHDIKIGDTVLVKKHGNQPKIEFPFEKPTKMPHKYDNQTMVRIFLLLNISEGWFFIPLLFSLVYSSILVSNFCIIMIIMVEKHLHTPMYFFISNLSVVDACYSSSTLPFMIFNCAMGNRTVSFDKCIAQLYMFVFLGGNECILLAVMAYDRFVAICNPLHYPVVMNKKVCTSLVVASWVGAFLNAVLHTTMTANLTFCQMEISINHFYCDVPQLVEAACNPTLISKITLNVITVFLGLTPFLYISITYIQIISTIMKIKSSEGRQKAFSTCSSHLTIVTVFYGTSALNYNAPAGSVVQFKLLISLLYSILTPLINPIIYCLRNKEVKGVLKKHLQIPDYAHYFTSKV
ncbi:olfactory receptor 5V1-like [Gastrophryne carolinensis]